MRKTLLPYLFIPCHLVLGLLALGLVDAIPLMRPLQQGIILIVFILINLLYVPMFRLQAEVREHWTIKPIYLLVAFVIGGIISVFPQIAAIITGNAALSSLSVKQFSITSLLVTFVIVSWEELWFRGLILNYCNRSIPAIRLSVIMGLLFALLHLLNPAIHILVAGPALFFAGAMLTMLYFYYRSIWVVIGLHLGNNYFGSLVQGQVVENAFFAPDGYMSALLPATLFFLAAHKYKGP